MPELILTSIIAFITTNIDDVFILILFFGDRRYKAIDIYIGQYLGIGSLIILSLLGSLLGNFVDSKLIGLLGFFPIYLGVRQVIALLRARSQETNEEAEPRSSGYGILNVAIVTIANGGDNIGTYIPLFATISIVNKVIMISVFLVMVFVLVTLARYLRNHPLLTAAIARYAHIITPAVLILLGIFILIENGSQALIGL